MLLVIYFEYYLCQIHWKQRRETASTMASLERELQSISSELNNLSLMRKQLSERKTMQCILQELRKRTEFKQTEGADSYQHEIDRIDDKLKRATERTAELQKRLEHIRNSKEKRDESKVSFSSSQRVVPGITVPASKAVYVEAPPNISEEAASNQCEIDSIHDKLKQLTGRTAELQKRHENILNTKDESNGREASFTSCQKVAPDDSVPAVDVVYVEAPPTIPAPTVILDLEKLPTVPCRTQCPGCQQFIMTETFTSTSSVTWLVCFMTALVGCVAGCCLLPFCLDRFKSTTHKCPKCRTSIYTVKKL